MNNYSTKQCSKCKEIKVKSSEFFYRSKQSDDGLRSDCRKCCTKSTKTRNAKKLAIKKANERKVKEGYKFCTKCDRELPLDIEHYYRGKSKHGFVGKCKECMGSTFGVKFPNKVYKAKEGHMFCGKCHKELPLNSDHFYKHSQSNNGWGSRCKICWGAKEYGITHINVINRSKKGHKFCSICKEELPHRMFSRLAERKDGYSSRCKNCDSSISKEYSSRPESKIKKAERFREWRKQYYSTPEGKALNKKHIHLRKSRKANAIYNYSEAIWFDTLKYFNNECAYCGNATKDLQQEHVIPLSKGGYYTKQNIIPACPFCNISKHNRNLMDWYPNQPNYSKDRLDKINKWIGVKNNMQQLSIL